MGCYLNSDWKLSTEEIKATQKLNSRTRREKTYHLMISFHKEDLPKLTPKNLKEIEKRFAKALGFEDHQRLCSLHVNTENPHIHVAYNMINKYTYNRHDPYYDFQIRDKVCREIEKDFGLKRDNGIEVDFIKFIKENEEIINSSFKDAKSWDDLHNNLGQIGITINLRGNGCILAVAGKENDPTHRMKLSDFDRNLSKTKLIKEFGEFKESTTTPEKCSFEKKSHRYSQKSNRFESQTGLKSFETFVLEKKERLKELADESKSWQDFHKNLSSEGLEIKSRGAGFILVDRRNKKNKIPFSKSELRIKKLEEKFGAFEASNDDYSIKRWYKPEPKKKLNKQEKEAWAIYIDNYSNNKNWNSFKRNLEKFLGAETGIGY